jgi:hypothetical protein
MKHTITSGVLILGLAATAIAQNKPAAAKADKKAATPAAEAPAKPKADPAASKSDSSYALGFRTGGTFGQQFGRFGVTATDLEQSAFMKGFIDAIKNGKPSIEECSRSGRKNSPKKTSPLVPSFLKRMASAKA